MADSVERGPHPMAGPFVHAFRDSLRQLAEDMATCSDAGDDGHDAHRAGAVVTTGLDRLAPISVASVRASIRPAWAIVAWRLARLAAMSGGFRAQDADSFKNTRRGAPGTSVWQTLRPRVPNVNPALRNMRHTTCTEPTWNDQAIDTSGDTVRNPCCDVGNIYSALRGTTQLQMQSTRYERGMSIASSQLPSDLRAQRQHPHSSETRRTPLAHDVNLPRS
jgi:hypothetical protein